MSFAFMPLYTGDFLRDTLHLSCSENGVYLRLLIHYWDQKAPAPLDERKLCGIVNARSADEIEALRRVLAEFFVRMEDGWYNSRMQREIERAEVLSGRRSAAGKLGYQAKAKQLPGKSLAGATTPTPTLTPTLTPTKGKEKEARAVRAVSIETLIADGLTEQTANEWLAHRRRKRSPLTPMAWDGIKAEAGKAGWKLEDAVCKCLARGWTGFEADWVSKESISKGRHSETGVHMAGVMQDWLNNKRAA